MPRGGSAGENTHIGIIDSACELPDVQTQGFDVRGGDDHSFINSNKSDTTDHGSRVFHRLSFYCQDATFSLYQAITEDGSLSTVGLSEAITAAINDNVDILNISAGRQWAGPIISNPEVHEVQRAIDAGIVIVAAAGQYHPSKHDNQPAVYCPAAHDDVIAVGGLETICPVTPGSEPDDEQKGPYFAIPPTNADVSELTPTETFCGADTCSKEGSCFANQTEREWEYNPLPTNNKPDILAPMHLFVSSGGENEQHELLAGTSFASPIVAASLANIFSEMREQGVEIPPPGRVREFVYLTGAEIPGNQVKYDAWELRKEFGLV